MMESATSMMDMNHRPHPCVMPAVLKEVPPKLKAVCKKQVRFLLPLS